ncbi:MAG: hypothetical protein ACRDBG_17175 [Waterburya sp.]
MMQEIHLKNALERIINWNKKYNLESTYLVSGIEKSELENILKDFPFKLPNELLFLYQYGYANIENSSDCFDMRPLQKNLDDCLRFHLPAKIPISTLHALGIYRYNLSEACYRDEIYNKIIANYQFDYCELPLDSAYFVKCYKQERDCSPVYIRLTEEEPLEYASSLTNLMLTFAECYETGAYYLSLEREEDLERGEEFEYWDIKENWEAVELIFKKYNPEQVDTWRELWRD